MPLKKFTLLTFAFLLLIIGVVSQPSITEVLDCNAEVLLD